MSSRCPSGVRNRTVMVPGSWSEHQPAPAGYHSVRDTARYDSETATVAGVRHDGDWSGTLTVRPSALTCATPGLTASSRCAYTYATIPAVIAATPAAASPIGQTIHLSSTTLI